jgi:hypothetical protein
MFCKPTYSSPFVVLNKKQLPHVLIQSCVVPQAMLEEKNEEEPVIEEKIDPPQEQSEVEPVVQEEEPKLLGKRAKRVEEDNVKNKKIALSSLEI